MNSVAVRAISLGLAAVGGSLGLLAGRQSNHVTLAILGDFKGQLSPCGCSKPMVGGIKRAASVVAALRASGPTILLSNGAFTDGTVGEQQSMKARAIAESLHVMQAAAVNLSGDDCVSGFGNVSTMQSVLGPALIAEGAKSADRLPLQDATVAFGLPVHAVSSQLRQISGAVGSSAPSARLSDDAVGIALLDGSAADAKKLAATSPMLAVIVYRSSGDASRHETKVGETWLVSPGSEGKSVLSIDLTDNAPVKYAVTKLTENIVDNPAVTAIYQRYLREVSNSNLLESQPKISSAKYVGSAKCQSCHSRATKVWAHSQHSSAMKTLASQLHDRDPDCVSCHVVGFGSARGFISPKKTPNLGGVGCESCHGSGDRHVRWPKSVRMAKVGKASCVSCHVSTQSPGFSFPAYWRRIAH